VFSITQFVLFLGYAIANWCSVTQVSVLYWLGVVMTICLLTTWLWGIWYLVRLILLYWIKDWLPLWMNASLISCTLVAIGIISLLWSKTIVLTGNQLPLDQCRFLLLISFCLGSLLPTLNNQRFPNIYFA
jgi:hypothetical protein